MKKIYFASVVSLFFFACTSDNDKEETQNISSSSVGTNNSSSSSVISSSSSDGSSSSSSVISSSSSDGGSSSSSVISSSSSDGGSSSSSSVGLCDDFVDGTEKEHYGMQKKQFCDKRDGKRYVYVAIDGKDWMAENLNFNASDSKCSNCDTYGRLYDWTRAMTMNGSGVCPSGWHIPSDAEWTALMIAVGGTERIKNRYYEAATKLKTKSDWIYDEDSDTDDYGFSALPGGCYSAGDGSPDFSNVGSSGFWWSSTKSDDHSAWAWITGIYDFMQRFDSYTGGILYSVRCVRD